MNGIADVVCVPYRSCVCLSVRLLISNALLSFLMVRREVVGRSVFIRFGYANDVVVFVLFSAKLLALPDLVSTNLLYPKRSSSSHNIDVYIRLRRKNVQNYMFCVLFHSRSRTITFK